MQHCKTHSFQTTYILDNQCHLRLSIYIDKILKIQFLEKEGIISITFEE